MKVAILAATVLALSGSPLLAQQTKDSAKEYAPGQRQKEPGDAKKFAPGQRQNEPGQAKEYAPGQQQKDSGQNTRGTTSGRGGSTRWVASGEQHWAA
jgi:hypothetical protein